MSADGPGSDDEADATPDGGRSSLDAVLDAFANRRRRYALYFLQDETTATLREVAVRVAAWENDRPVNDVDPDFADGVYVDFYHRHLPKLAESNVVAYDPREERLRYDCPDTVGHVLEICRWMESPADGPD